MLRPPSAPGSTTVLTSSGLGYEAPGNCSADYSGGINDNLNAGTGTAGTHITARAAGGGRVTVWQTGGATMNGGGQSSWGSTSTAGRDGIWLLGGNGTNANPANYNPVCAGGGGGGFRGGGTGGVRQAGNWYPGGGGGGSSWVRENADHPTIVLTATDEWAYSNAIPGKLGGWLQPMMLCQNADWDKAPFVNTYNDTGYNRYFGTVVVVYLGPTDPRNEDDFIFNW